MKNSYNLASHVELVKSGNDFFEKIHYSIRNSKQTIYLQTYIFSDDSTGLETIKYLTEAVNRGVEVYLLVDAFGSHELKSHTIKAIKKSGIHFRTYSPIFSKWHIRFGRRLHHKILVSDENEALIGGINIDDKYHLRGKDSPWLDYAVYVNGNVCEEISIMCRRLWSGKGYFRRKRIKIPRIETHIQLHPVHVKLDQNDWLYGKKGVSRSLNNAIRHAHSSVTIIASYFLPGMKMRSSLRNAAKRNVKVKMILPGVSDVKLVKYATEYWYAWMLRNNIELYEWNKTILHGKLMAVDDNWVSIGSYNINNLSHFSSIETNLEVKDESFSNTVKLELENVMGQCDLITSSGYSKRMNLFEKFLYWSSFQLVRFLFALQFKVLSKE
jgi:cardiolipin synthase A/B